MARLTADILPRTIYIMHRSTKALLPFPSNLDTSLQHILASPDPTEPLRSAVAKGPVLRQLNQHMFSSIFSSQVDEHSTTWLAKAADTALDLLQADEHDPYSAGWLLETAFHGSLAVSGTAQFYNNLQRIQKALRRFERSDLNRSSQYVKGLLAYAYDDLEAAERAFWSLPDLADSHLLAHHSGYAAFRAPSFYRTLAAYKPTVELTFLRDSDHRDASSVVLCSADELYLAAFGDEFLTQVLRASPTTHLHFHLINVSDPTGLTHADLLSHNRVSLTIEHTDVADPGKYTIMARFISLPTLLKHYAKPILVTDIDMLVKSDPSLLNGHDAILGFCRIPAARHVPATAIIGHQNLFHPSETGLAFAQMLSGYIHYMCAHGRGLWAADQVALLILSRIFGNLLSIGDMREYDFHYSSSPDRALRKETARQRLGI